MAHVVGDRFSLLIDDAIADMCLKFSTGSGIIRLPLTVHYSRFGEDPIPFLLLSTSRNQPTFSVHHIFIVLPFAVSF